MSALRVLAARTSGLWAKRKMEARLEEEMRCHMELLVEENIRRGMTAEEARRAARREFGGVEQVKETWRDTLGFPALDSFAQDVRHAIRAMRRNPGFSLLVVAVLAVGIGGATTVFSILNTLFYRPLRYPHPERLVLLGEAAARQRQGGRMTPVRHLIFEDWQAHAQSFEAIAAYRFEFFNVTVAGRPERVRGERVSQRFFEVLGVVPMLGRGFTASDCAPGAPAVVVLSEEYWRRALDGRSDVVGQTLRINGTPSTIAGVMPGRLRASLLEGSARLWAPLVPAGSERNRETPFAYVMARLKPGAGIERARSEMAVISKRLAAQYPAAEGELEARVQGLQDILREARSSPAAKVIMMAVALLLLTSCANAANLLLGRAASLQKEVALRVALGAARWRVVRHFLTESLAFAAAGGAAGFALGILGTAWCSARLASVLARDGIDGFAMDGRVLVFALLVSLATAIMFGILPALRGTGVDVCEALKESGPGHSGGVSRQRLTGLLVVVEVTLSVVLVTIAGLLISSISQYWRIDWGFPIERRLLAAVTPSEGNYGAEAARLRFYTELLARAQQLAGVELAAVAGTVPLDLGVPFLRVAAEKSDRAQAAYRAVSPAYHETLGIALRRGRLFNDADRQGGAPVALVSESLARKLWPEQEAVGARIQVNGTWRQVVGVTADVNQSMARMPRHEVAVPFTQAPPNSIRLVLRTHGEPSATAPSVRQMIAALDPDLPVTDLQTFHAASGMLRAPYEFILGLLGAFAVCALLLSGAGIYGVTSRGVAVRTREIGIRVALGAEPRQVLRGVLRTGLKLALAGTVLGSLGALFAIKALLTQIWWATPVPAFVWIVPVAAFMAALALVASFVPARRATSIAPAAALRAE